MSSAQFKFAEDEGGQPKEVIDVAPVELFLVSYRDVANKKSTRLAFRAPGSKSTYVFNEKAGGTFIATSTRKWFHDAVVEKLREKGLEGGQTDGDQA